MTLQDILRTKGSIVFTIEPTATLEDVVLRLVQHNVGALVVCDRDCSEGERPVGIITERDILHVTAKQRGLLGSMRVAEYMTTRLITATPQDSVDTVMGLLTEHRIRHVPVLNGNKLVGLVSIGDIVKSQLDRLAMENQFMKDYIRS
ncbi:MAG: CBS domain-containing protein [Pirellulales bacterium]|nr:CBS domain-containing protein [Pirellulales bacterium]